MEHHLMTLFLSCEDSTGELTAVPENAAVTYLFGKRFDVQMYNQMMLDEMPGEQKVFLSDDEGISRFNCDTLKCKKRISS